MLDEGLLTRAFNRPAQDTPPSTIDAVMHLAQSANYQPAAEQAAELIEGGCRDVRVFVAYTLGVFAERGPSALPGLFEAISGALTSAASQGQNPRTTDVALRFGFRMLKAQLDFDERQSEAVRQVWLRYLGPASTAAVQRACAGLRTAIHALVEAPVCADELGAVIARLDAYFTRNSQELKPSRRVLAESRATPEPEPRPAEVAPHSSAATTPLLAPPAFARRASDYEADGIQLVVAPALQHFMRKLEAFERLIAVGSLGKAAIVAEDIRNVLAGFDPMVYLPNLLAPHFRLLSDNVEELSPYWEQGVSASRQALEQLYRVDLDAFVEA